MIAIGMLIGIGVTLLFQGIGAAFTKWAIAKWFSPKQ